MTPFAAGVGILDDLGRGPIEVTEPLATLLETVWGQLDGGGDTAMNGTKLHRRMEDIVWEPPVLSFRIERHGGVMCGSIYAEIQEWRVDFNRGTASVDPVGRRQIRARQPRLDVSALAAQIVALVEGGEADPRLKWSSDYREVQVIMGQVIPNEGPQQTVQGRRRRFASHLATQMQEADWVSQPKGSRYIFAKG